MKKPWLMFSGICGIVLLIVLFCVIFGGFSSFTRSQGRVKKAAQLLVEACTKRDVLLDQLDAFSADTAETTKMDEIKNEIKKIESVSAQFATKETLVDQKAVSKFVEGQEKITQLLSHLLKTKTTLNSKAQTNQYNALIREIHTAQDNIFVIRKKYDDEVAYYNIRTTAIPGSLIAKIFGFDKIRYHPVGSDKLLPSRKMFPPKP